MYRIGNSGTQGIDLTASALSWALAARWDAGQATIGNPPNLANRAPATANPLNHTNAARPNGPTEPSTGLRPQADALGTGAHKTHMRPERALETATMPQSLAKMYAHVIFSTKHRERYLVPEMQTDLHAYMGGTLNGLDCIPIEINSEPEHVHALFLLGRTIALSEAIGALKKSSNDWFRARDPKFSHFYWQGGYGAFSVSQSGVEEVRNYIRTQHEHHKQSSFQDEFRAFLRRYEIEFDERYVWD